MLGLLCSGAAVDAAAVAAGQRPPLLAAVAGRPLPVAEPVAGPVVLRT